MQESNADFQSRLVNYIVSNEEKPASIQLDQDQWFHLVKSEVYSKAIRVRSAYLKTIKPNRMYDSDISYVLWSHLGCVVIFFFCVFTLQT